MSRRQIGALALFCLAVVIARVATDAGRELRVAAALEGSEPHEAAVHYARAIHAYLPGMGTMDAASTRLVALADAAAARGDTLEERFCLEELRSAWLAVRGLRQPGQAWIRQAEARLVPLLLDAEGATWPDPALPRQERAARLTEAYARRADPRPAWAAAMALGWFGWIGCAAAAIVRGLPDREGDPVRWATLGRWAAAGCGCYGLWLAGVAFA